MKKYFIISFLLYFYLNLLAIIFKLEVVMHFIFKRIIFNIIIISLLSFTSLFAQYWTVDHRVKNRIRKEKLENQLPLIMKEYKIPVWIVFNRDPNDDPDNIFIERYRRLDPVSELIGAENTFYPSIFIFTDNGERIALIEKEDYQYIYETKIYTKICFYKYTRQTGINPLLNFFKEEILRINPEKIGMNFSETEPVADGLTIGLRKIIEDTIGEKFSSRLVSAEDIIVTLWGQKTKEELKYIKKSTEISNELMIDAFKNIKPGKTTKKDIFNFIRTKMEVNGWKVGWNQKICPIVRILPAENLPEEKIIAKPGSIIGINAGVLTMGYSNDLDRTAYILRKNEKEPPKDIQFMWKTLRKTVEAVAKAMKPGVSGIEVDKIARKIIKDAGFKEYWYQTGHPVGVWVHDIGTYIGPEHPHYGKKVFLKLHEGEVFAIEPGISMFSKELNKKIGLHLQEMIVVTKEGGKYLIPPQKEIFLIR